MRPFIRDLKSRTREHRRKYREFLRRRGARGSLFVLELKKAYKGWKSPARIRRGAA